MEDKFKRFECSCVNRYEEHHNRECKRKLSLRRHRLDKAGNWICLTCGRNH